MNQISGSHRVATPVPDAASTHLLQELIRRSASGDQEAFRDLYDATSPRVFGLALKVVGRRDFAEEAALDAFTQIWREAESYDPDRGNPLGWILSIARSRAIDHLRSRRFQGLELGLDAVLRAPDQVPDPEELHHGSERDRLVRVTLAALPKEQRTAIEAAYFSGLSYAEVARATDLPVGTVKTRIRKGMTTMRRRLAGARRSL